MRRSDDGSRYSFEGGRAMPRWALAVVGLIFLASCETQLSVPRYADITFTHRPVINVDVAEIQIVRAFVPNATPANVEGEFPVSPMEMAARWAQDRLRAVGSSGSLTYTIQEAGVIETSLAKSDGLTGIVTVDQSERYDATLTVQVSATNPANGQSAGTASTVRRSRTVAEDVTLNEREAVWYAMTEALAEDLDAQMDSVLPQFLGGLLK